VRTLSTVWLGSTMGCAECHDHKFDPFTSKDFYSMKAFFADIRETGQIGDRGASAWGAKLSLPSPEQAAQLASVKKRIDATQAELKQNRSDCSRSAGPGKTVFWRLQVGRTGVAIPASVVGNWVHGAKLTIYNGESVDSNYYLKGSLHSEQKRGDGLVVASGPNPDNETYVVTLKPGNGSWMALGIDVFQDESLPGNRVARGADRFVLTEGKPRLPTRARQGRNFPLYWRPREDSASHRRILRWPRSTVILKPAGAWVSASRTIRF